MAGVPVGMHNTLRLNLVEPLRLFIAATTEKKGKTKAVQEAEVLVGLAGVLALRLERVADGARFQEGDAARLSADLRRAWGQWIEAAAGPAIYHHAAQASDRAKKRVVGVKGYRNKAGETLTVDLLKERYLAAGGRRENLEGLASEFGCQKTYVSDLYIEAGLKDVHRGRRRKA